MDFQFSPLTRLENIPTDSIQVYMDDVGMPIQDGPTSHVQ